MRLKFFILVISFIVLLPNSNTFGIGTGGMLVYVPQAEIFINDIKQDTWKAYVHPLEGGWLIFPDSLNFCFAFDKVKKQIIKIEKKNVKKSNWDNVINIPHDSPIEVLKNRPYFSQFYVTGKLPNNKILKILVKQ